MVNMQDFIDGSNAFRQFKIDELLFVEFECPPYDEPQSIWWHNNYFVFILAGETTMKTPVAEYILKTGDFAFAKKGSIFIQNHSAEMFCELLVFVPDDFIRTVMQKYNLSAGKPALIDKSDTLIPLMADEVLTAYCHSLVTYFRQSSAPPESLLRIKFEELIIAILSGNNHKPLKNYFSEIYASAKPSIREIMEANFFSNLSLEEYARLCVRSLSAFKQEFKNIFNTTPGKWLLEKRLQYSRFLIENTNATIDEVCMQSGFENRSHFIRVFKSRYGISPGQMRVKLKMI